MNVDLRRPGIHAYAYGGIRDGELPEPDLPRCRGGGRVGLLRCGRGGSEPQVDVALRELDGADADLFVAQVDAVRAEDQSADLRPGLHPRQGVAVMPHRPGDLEAADICLPAQQPQRGDIHGQPLASEQRVAAVDEERLRDDEPQGESQADASDREFHAEVPGHQHLRLPAESVLYSRDIEQPSDQKGQKQQDDQRPKGIFEYLSQHSERGDPFSDSVRAFGGWCLRAEGRIGNERYKKSSKVISRP